MAERKTRIGTTASGAWQSWVVDQLPDDAKRAGDVITGPDGDSADAGLATPRPAGRRGTRRLAAALFVSRAASGAAHGPCREPEVAEDDLAHKSHGIDGDGVGGQAAWKGI
jgi:hypothetical protein